MIPNAWKWSQMLQNASQYSLMLQKCSQINQMVKNDQKASKTIVWFKLKCYQNLNIIKTEISLKLKCHQNKQKFIKIKIKIQRSALIPMACYLFEVKQFTSHVIISALEACVRVTPASVLGTRVRGDWYDPGQLSSTPRAGPGQPTPTRGSGDRRMWQESPASCFLLTPAHILEDSLESGP